MCLYNKLLKKQRLNNIVQKNERGDSFYVHFTLVQKKQATVLLFVSRFTEAKNTAAPSQSKR